MIILFWVRLDLQRQLGKLELQTTDNVMRIWFVKTEAYIVLTLSTVLENSADDKLMMFSFQETKCDSSGKRLPRRQFVKAV